jgi:hypothetical protein
MSVEATEGHLFTATGSFSEVRNVLVGSADSGQSTGLNPDFYIPLNDRGNPTSPLEQGTDIPLPIVTSIGGDSKHHGFFYESDYMNGSLGLQAVHVSRLQAGLGEGPHRNFHRTADGTKPPADHDAAYAMTVLNIAGYVTRFGVKIDGDPSIGEISPQEMEALTKPGVFITESEHKIASRIIIGKSLMVGAIEQSFDHVDPSSIEEFLGITAAEAENDDELRQRRTHLGNMLINEAIRAAVEDVSSAYQEARTEARIRSDAPVSPWEVVKSQISGYEPDYFDMLSERLAREYSNVAVDA